MRDIENSDELNVIRCSPYITDDLLLQSMENCKYGLNILRLNCQSLHAKFDYIRLLMLYSLCMKFQAELVNFQDQLENRVLCKTFLSRQNSEVHPSVTTHEELKNVFESYNY